ncbi:MAG TPA: universal stress protein [Mycobacterium sp.]|nr:universal stress protein [Mycobacterium sp.]
MADTPGQPAARIVVGVDGSAPSKLALRWADYLARAMGGAQIRAVIAWHSPGTYGWPSYAPEDGNPEAAAERCLSQAVDEVFATGRPLGMDLVVREGGAAKVLLEQSRDVSMLIVGSRGHGGFAGLLLGSVSMACAEHAGCPVLVVHGAAPPPRPH